MKNRFAFILSSFLLLTLSFQTFVFAQSGSSSALASKPNTEKIATTTNRQPVTGETIESDMSEALTVIQDNYVDGKKLDYNEVFKASIEGMLRSLDPHSNYFDAKETEQFRTEQSSRYFGIGASIGDLRDGDTTWTYIKSTFEGAPANRAGLRYGDKILEVNGTSMKNKTFTEVRNFLRGPRGTVAKIKVEHYQTKKVEDVELVRDSVPQPSIPEAYMIRPGVGYIAMSGGFNQTTGDEFDEAIKKLKKQNVQNLIVDLRGNGGGLVSQAYRVANVFLQRGQVVFSQKGRARNNSGEFPAENPNPEQVPLIVLVNRNTASASEILSGALQDHDRALIVGENSFGKGLVQTPFPLNYETMVLLTTAKYLTPSGRLIQRDYSNGNIYDYYNEGSLRDENQKPIKPTGAESKTDTGRSVYGGGGIQPDEYVKPATITFATQKSQAGLLDPLFAFTLELSAGKIAGFESYKVEHPVVFDYDLKATDFPVTEALYQTFKKFALAKPSYKVTAAQIEKERAFIERQIRF